jgi:hypothetical protein
MDIHSFRSLLAPLLVALGLSVLGVLIAVYLGVALD